MTCRASEPAGAETLGRLVHRGSELLREGKAAEARDLFEQAVRLAPDDAAARHLLALSCFRVGHLERALLLYEALAMELPGSSAAKLNLSVVLLKLGRASAARRLLAEIVGTVPDHRRAWGYLGVALEQLGLVHEAEEALITGHLAGAAKRLRQRHAELFAAPGAVREFRSERVLLTPHKRRTLPVGEGPGGALATPGSLKPSRVPVFAATLPPRASPDPVEALEEISFEQTVSPSATPRPVCAGGDRPRRPVLPLLDNALSSLLVMPHEASVGVHPTGLLMVGLVEGADAREGGFAARADAVHAVAGRVRREPLEDRSFERLSGTGQVVLASAAGARLVPLEMDADVAFIVESLVVAFDHSLLHEVGTIRDSSGASRSVIRFRGDGVIVLGLEGAVVSLEVSGGDSVAARASALIGWLGDLSQKQSTRDDAVVVLGGNGTVLLGAR